MQTCRLTAVPFTSGTKAPRRGLTMQRTMNVLALVKDEERYVFLYDDESTATLLQTLGKQAADKELSFTWYDAAVLSQKLRQTSAPAPVPAPHLSRRFELPLPSDDS